MFKGTDISLKFPVAMTTWSLDSVLSSPTRMTPGRPESTSSGDSPGVGL